MSTNGRKLEIPTLTYLAFYLNGAAGSGKYVHLDIETIQDRIGDGSIFQFLKKELGMDLDLSILDDERCEELLEEWRGMFEIDERRKMCVEKGGLNLLVAYLLEGIQSRARAMR